MHCLPNNRYDWSKTSREFSVSGLPLVLKEKSFTFRAHDAIICSSYRCKQSDIMHADDVRLISFAAAVMLPA